MATAAISQGGRIRKEERYYQVGSTSSSTIEGQYRYINSEIVRTVGYDSLASAKSAAEAAASANVEATYERDGEAGFYSVTTETFTYGEWTTIT